MSIARMRSVVLDCPDTRKLAEFYRDLLDWKIVYEESAADGGWIMLSDGGPTRLAFQQAPEHHRPRWPDPESSQQFHLDFEVDDLDTAERQALELGATRADVQPYPDDFRVLLDPAGHPFCLCVDVG